MHGAWCSVHGAVYHAQCTVHSVECTVCDACWQCHWKYHRTSLLWTDLWTQLMQSSHGSKSTRASAESVASSRDIRYRMMPEHHNHNRITALFQDHPGWAGARRELLDFMVQGKINRGRHTDHPAGCHSIRTNQCPSSPSPHIFTGRPTNSVKALKATMMPEHFAVKTLLLC